MATTTKQRQPTARARRLLAGASAVSDDALRYRLQRLLESKIEFIECDEFRSRAAVKRILQVPMHQCAPARLPRAPRGLTPFLASLYATPLLSPGEEAQLFRKWNYLKYRASRKLWELPRQGVTADQIQSIESDLSQAAELKNRIVQANLRLVVSIAKKFLDRADSLHELVSDGILSLMRAAEKFDFSRGYKFSTYATYAIRRNLFRSVIQTRKAHSRFVAADAESLQLTAAAMPSAAVAETQIADLRTEICRAMEVLSERERRVISLRFGFDPQAKPMTLQEIATIHGVCKERIRQIQTRAIEKLHKVVAGKPYLREIVDT